MVDQVIQRSKNGYFASFGLNIFSYLSEMLVEILVSFEDRSNEKFELFEADDTLQIDVDRLGNEITERM